MDRYALTIALVCLAATFVCLLLDVAAAGIVFAVLAVGFGVYALSVARRGTRA